MNCLICHNEISSQIGWKILFSKETQNYTCDACSCQFQKIEGDTCKICDRPLQLLEERFIKDGICYDCIRWEQDTDWGGYLTRNYSIFIYDHFIKEVISQFKFRGDYFLARVFSDYIQAKIKLIDYDLLVPIPLSKERLYERGFNQAEALAKEAGYSIHNLLKRTHTEKQSKKSRSERIHIPQVFEIEENTLLKNKKILLIDDIYTTGSTLRHAAKILKESGAQSVCSLTLARG